MKIAKIDYDKCKDFFECKAGCATVCPESCISLIQVPLGWLEESDKELLHKMQYALLPPGSITKRVATLIFSDNPPARGKCTGCGDCVEACPNKAITVEGEENKMKIARINRDKCTCTDAGSVWSCVGICVHMAATRVSDMGYQAGILDTCIGCGDCVECCPEEAITLEDHPLTVFEKAGEPKLVEKENWQDGYRPEGYLSKGKQMKVARINRDKCKELRCLMECCGACPEQGALIPYQLSPDGPSVNINQAGCTGCGNCVEACPRKAITLEVLTVEKEAGRKQIKTALAEGLNERIHKLKETDPKEICLCNDCRPDKSHNYLTDYKATFEAQVELLDKRGWTLQFDQRNGNYAMGELLTYYGWSKTNPAIAIWMAWCKWKEQGSRESK